VPLVLLLLRQWSSYGYELMERLTTFGWQLMNPGTFYRMLRHLEEEGLVTSQWEMAQAGPARRMYAITAAGEAYLKLWADSLDQYQKMLTTLFQLYTGRPATERKQEET
jgi:poly-beta-hydroxybutyrate-responsive repressor